MCVSIKVTIYYRSLNTENTLQLETYKAASSTNAKMVEISGWRNLFLEVSAISESAECQYGIANLSYSNWKGLLCALTHSVVSTLASDLQECSRNLTELIETLQRLHNRWEEYKSFLEGSAQYNTLLTIYPAAWTRETTVSS